VSICTATDDRSSFSLHEAPNVLAEQRFGPSSRVKLGRARRLEIEHFRRGTAFSSVAVAIRDAGAVWTRGRYPVGLRPQSA
jgi:hypothetical protein